MDSLAKATDKDLERVCPEYKELEIIERRCMIFNEGLRRSLNFYLKEIKWLLADSNVSETDIVVGEQGIFPDWNKYSTKTINPEVKERMERVKDYLHFHAADILRSFEITTAKAPAGLIQILIVDANVDHEFGLDFQIKFFIHQNKIKILKSHLSNGVFVIIY